MLKRINLYGGPGIGKSTLAADIYSLLKKKGHKVELVREWIKGWVYEGKRPDYWDQLYILSKQIQAEKRVLKAGHIVVTDAPIRMQMVYCPSSLYGAFSDITRSWEDYHRGFHVLLKRNVIYQTEGRYHTEREANDLDDRIKDAVGSYGIMSRFMVARPGFDGEVERIIEGWEKCPVL